MDQLDRELKDLWSRLAPPQRERVLEYIRSLDGTLPHPKPFSDLLPFIGSIPKEDLKLMSDYIETEFGKVDPTRW